jgi:hypothetical protein
LYLQGLSSSLAARAPPPPPPVAKAYENYAPGPLQDTSSADAAGIVPEQSQRPKALPRPPSEALVSAAASRPPPAVSTDSASDLEEGKGNMPAGEEHQYLYSAYTRDGRHRVCTAGGAEQGTEPPTASAAAAAVVTAAATMDTDIPVDVSAESVATKLSAPVETLGTPKAAENDDEEDEEEEEGIYVPLPIIHARPNSLMRPRSQISVLDLSDSVDAVAGESGFGGAVLMRHGSGHGNANAQSGANRASMLMAALQTTGDASAAAKLDTLIDMASQKVCC